MKNNEIFRLAQRQDLPQLQAMYRALVQAMNGQGLCIWDEVYPCAFLEEDIRLRRLYLLQEGREILAAFALCGEAPGEQAIQWQSGPARALYLDRLGVSAAHARQGIGSRMLGWARKAAKAQGADALRLFVVEGNLPALRLYEKNGFARRPGVFDEVIDGQLTLREYGYEVAL